MTTLNNIFAVFLIPLPIFMGIVNLNLILKLRSESKQLEMFFGIVHSECFNQFDGLIKINDEHSYSGD